MALGNVLMTDDGIGLKVLKEIEKSVLKVNTSIEVIYGETDFVYCLNNVCDDDIIIIVDGSYFEIKPGTVTVKSLSDCSGEFHKTSSQHQISLVDMIMDYKNNIEVYFIGIEVAIVDFGASLSDELNHMFEEICNGVLDGIKTIINSKSGGKNA